MQGKFGQTVFFQFDGFKFRAGKIIKYTENGHRDKSSDKPVSWVHKWTKDFDEDKQELDLCFFGLHLVDESNTICLVESEKTGCDLRRLIPESGLDGNRWTNSIAGCKIECIGFKQTNNSVPGHRLNSLLARQSKKYWRL